MYCAHAILIELLIVVAILGILAAVIIPNVTTFMDTGRFNAARTEAENVKTAALAYFADRNTDTVNGWPSSGTNLQDNGYTTGTIKGTYTFTDNGTISAATYGTTGFDWDATG